ncbi:hypothetical protein PC112_g9701 [Phytophthora cactorum]|nr:hypothetical protein PC112_g9701 [Phytophthora cactorum]KAG2989745.1 hypothetical protein PC120_g23104 [Phytophthora cactorum]KAG3065652.1 hypothetical protein PC121_g11256 [Phytophthora cactorum]KAG4041688.1 hypothetical protein PC123_g22803 [Phytophthora cactorum]
MPAAIRYQPEVPTGLRSVAARRGFSLGKAGHHPTRASRCAEQASRRHAARAPRTTDSGAQRESRTG